MADVHFVSELFCEERSIYFAIVVIPVQTFSGCTHHIQGIVVYLQGCDQRRVKSLTYKAVLLHLHQKTRNAIYIFYLKCFLLDGSFPIFNFSQLLFISDQTKLFE